MLSGNNFTSLLLHIDIYKFDYAVVVRIYFNKLGHMADVYMHPVLQYLSELTELATSQGLLNLVSIMYHLELARTKKES